MKSASLQPPRPPKKLARFADEAMPDAIEDDTTYTDLEICDREYSSQLARRIVFARCAFDRVGFAQSELPEVEWSDLQFNDCDLANAVWRKAIFHRTELNACRLLGIQASEAHFGSTQFRECNASLAQFRFSVFKGVSFEN